MSKIKACVNHYVYSHLFLVQWKDVNKPDVINEEGGQPCWRTDVLPTRMWYTRSLMLGFSWGNWHRSCISGHQPVVNTLAPCSAAPPSLCRAVAFIHMRRRRDSHMGGGLAGVGVGSGAAALPSLPSTAQTRVSSVGHLWGMNRHEGGSFSQQEQFPQPFTLLSISSCSFFLSSSFCDRRSAGGSGKLLLLFRILLFWVFHRSAYKLPGMLRRALWLPRSATLPWERKKENRGKKQTGFKDKNCSKIQSYESYS